VVAAALVFRIQGLSTHPLDNDEPASLGLCSLEMWAQNLDSRLHPPFAQLLMGWFAGCRMDIDVGRGVSAVAGILTAALAFVLARRRAGRGAGILAGTFVAFAPAILAVSQLARGYALLGFLVLASHACLSWALETGRSRFWWLYSLAVALALATEYSALAPLVADLVVTAYVVRRRARTVIALIGSFSSGFAASGWMLGFFVPSLSLGIGGPPQPATGAWTALVEIGLAYSGVLGPMIVLFGGALVVAACERKLLHHEDARLVVSLVAIVAVVVAGGALTAVRPRYALHGLPIAAILVATSAFLTRRLGAIVAAGFCAVSHALFLPCYLAGTCERRELHQAPELPAVVTKLVSEPAEAIVVVPTQALGEFGWRVGRTLPGPDAKRPCPGALCAEGNGRRYYGIDDLSGLGAILGAERHFFLVARPRVEPPKSRCQELLSEADTVLFRCER
jgi:MFS family permease